MNKDETSTTPLAVRSDAGLGNNVVPIRPTVGISRMEQLRAFVAWEKEDNPNKTHIAEWALLEIERMQGAMLTGASILERDGDELGVGAALRRAMTPNAVIHGPRSGPAGMEG